MMNGNHAAVALVGAAVGSLLTLAWMRRSSAAGTAAAQDPLPGFPAPRECASPDDHDAWLALAHAARQGRGRIPSQSSFRVTAIVVYQPPPSFSSQNSSATPPPLRYVVGHNDESWSLANSCCAERAAFLQLGAVRGERRADVVRCVYLVSDAPAPITPGVLCREFMISSRLASPATRIVMEGSDGAPLDRASASSSVTPAGGPKQGQRIARTLGELWPAASPYMRLDAAGMVARGEALRAVVLAAAAAHRDDPAAAASPVPILDAAAWAPAAAAAATTAAGVVARDDAEAALRGAASAATQDGRGDLHPLRLGACAVLAGAGAVTARQYKALEYSCSLDPVAALLAAHHAATGLEAGAEQEARQEPGQEAKAEAAGARVACVAMVDQFGFAHAPMAVGRAALVEHGWGSVPVLFHDPRNGRLAAARATDLVPGIPSWERCAFAV